MSGAIALSRRVDRFAKSTATAVRLQDLYKVGRGDLKARLRFARFLHKEVTVRNAQLCKELRLLPFGLADTKGVCKVISTFSSYVDLLSDFPHVETAEDYDRFTELLKSILEDHTEVVATLGQGVLEVRSLRGQTTYEGIRSEVDLIFDRFFMKRIGLRFLIQHHIEAAKALPDTSGIIHSHVNTGQILRECAAEAKTLCLEKYGCTPDVKVVGDGGDSWADLDLSHNRQFTYVPVHLQFSCSVLLQNACYAVAERCKETGLQELPPVLAIFAYGQDEVTVKISDEGGGVPQDDIHYVWSYFSAPGGTTNALGRGHRHSAALVDSNTPKAGLPLARLFARYYGGDLTLKPIQGLGTDAYLVLNRLGQNCENLPRGVRVSPSMADSSVGDEASIGLESLGASDKFEVAFLKGRLKEFRISREADTALLNSLQAP